MILSLITLSILVRETSAVVGYWPFTKWPKGKFAIPQSRAQGCPESSDFAFEHGERTFDCEDDDSITQTSVRIHLQIVVDKEKDVHLSFCSKTADIKDELTGGEWPSGKYCFYRVGGSCPANFKSGWILWQDEKDQNRNERTGELPDGVYDNEAQTKMYFCCRTDGNPGDMITLPRGRAFYLLKYGDKCQAVEGTRSTEEYVLWDNDKRGPEQKWGGVIPETGVTDEGDVKLNFCYYTKISYCGDPGMPEHGEADSDRYTAGSTLKFSCDDGYRLSGIDEITCLTSEKWSSELPTCKEIHNCDEDNGGCDHTCIDVEAGKHRCECDEGYEAVNEGRSCVDVNECADPLIAGQCQHECVNDKGEYHCECKTGYQLNPDDKTCRDVDECKADPPICQQKCENSVGSYTCSCYPGYLIGSPPGADSAGYRGVSGVTGESPDSTVLSVNTCEDIDECKEQNPCEHYCTNTPGGFRCGCIEGFTLESDNRTCRNKNPCADNKLNPCSQPEHCELVDDDREFMCGCDEGYEIANDGKICLDINECTVGTHKCSQTCHNQEKGYTCSCLPGYVLDSDSKTCNDVDECDCGDTGCGGCQQKCVNTVGSYYCQCFPNYVPLRPDSSKCVIPYSLEDPCRTSDCINMQYADCWRIDGNATQCVCKPGYYFNHNNTNCIKGFCETNPCPAGQICQEDIEGRICLQGEDALGTIQGQTEENTTNNSNLMIVLITVFVVVLWFAVLSIVIMVIRKRRAKKMPRLQVPGGGYRGEMMQDIHPVHSLTVRDYNGTLTNRPSSLLDNPIYHANSIYNGGGHSDQDHEYEELDKLGYRKKNMFAANSYEEGMDRLDMDDGEAYSYAVTPGPPPPSHLLPPPLPLLPTEPEFV